MGLSSGAWHADNMHIRANMNNICAKGWQLCLWEISLALPSMRTWKEHSPPLHPRAPVELKKRESHSPPESQPTRPLFHFSWSELSTLGEAGATGSQKALTSPTCSHTLCGSLRGFQVRHRFVRLLGERRLAPCAGGQEREGGRLARSTQDSLWMKAGGLAEPCFPPAPHHPLHPRPASQPCSAILPTSWHAD